MVLNNLDSLICIIFKRSPVLWYCAKNLKIAFRFLFSNLTNMEYFFSARIDGLVKREESPEEMTESYVDRDDFMYYRQVTFGKRVKKFGPQEANSRPIVVG